MFDDLLAANQAYVAGYRGRGLRGTAAKHLAVVTCIDSRIDPLAMLGLHPGDAKILRNAGARITDDALRSLILAVNLLEVTRICVVQHTDCAMAGRGQDAVAAEVERRSGAPAGHVDFLTMDDQAASLRADLDVLRGSPHLRGATEVGGLLFDVDTGQLTPLD
jgi:carbonic anhydrase